MAEASSSSILANPLATVAQLESSSSQLDGVPNDLENSVRYAGANLIQAVGIVLRLPQDAIAKAIIIYTRFWIGPEGGSLRIHDAKDVATACLYLVTKPSAYSVPSRRLLNAVAYVESRNDEDMQLPKGHKSFMPTTKLYQELQARLFKHEAIVLRTIGFGTHVALPYVLCINYLQALEVFKVDAGPAIARRAHAHLNTLLFSPQLVYLTHQPPALATAAIYLAARQEGLKLPEVEWWEVFDTDREELGFLVVAILSMENFAARELQLWGGKKVPLTVAELEVELKTETKIEAESNQSP